MKKDKLGDVYSGIETMKNGLPLFGYAVAEEAVLEHPECGRFSSAKICRVRPSFLSRSHD